jgi:hypothetical protein
VVVVPFPEGVPMRVELTMCALLLCTAGCATTAPPPPAPALPAGLEVPSGNARLATLQAKGVQIYTCSPGADGAAPAWTFKAPQADLTDAAGAAAGKHYAGPTWEWPGGDLVVGEVLQKVPAPAGNIPWLLLKVKSSKGASPWGKVAFIQRLDTAGGVAPASGCDPAHLGVEALVAYTAAYALWGARP